MDFTLRQARQLETRLRNLTLEHQIIEVRAYDLDMAREDIEAGVDDLTDEIAYKLKLNEIRHHIKNLINHKNMECGVSDILNSRERITESEKVLDTLGPEDHTTRQLDSIKSSEDDTRKVSVVRGMHTYAASNILDDSELRRLQDELNNLNNTITITLNSDHTIYLQENGII